MANQTAVDVPAWLFLGFPTYLGAEITALVYSSLLGMVHLLVLAQFERQIYGLKWIKSARDEPGSGQTLSVLDRAHSVMQGSLLGRSGQWDRQDQPALDRRQPDRVINFGPGS
jgi:hypothetical protein